MIINTFRFKSHKLHYLDEGEGAPLIFLHNGGTDHSIWRYQTAHFAKSHRVLAIDLLGCGASDRPDIPFTLPLYVNMLETFISERGLESPVLIGNCIGAATALELALQKPDLARALILFNVYGGSSMIRSMKLVEWGWISPAMAARILCLPYLTSAEGLWGERPSREDPVFRHYMANIEVHPGVRQYRKNMVAGATSYNKFGSPCAVPENFPDLMLLWGAKNKVLPLSAGKRMREWLKPRIFREVPKSGHLAMCEAPAFVNREIEDFLSSSRARPPT